ncbi:Ca(2+)-dependent cysteine protease [Borealophlyctis nickersoniae]|nr:Ca(2+)-dependent cysteine protease [Borealophlyctis nickersoniae]
MEGRPVMAHRNTGLPRNNTAVTQAVTDNRLNKVVTRGLREDTPALLHSREVTQVLLHSREVTQVLLHSREVTQELLRNKEVTQELLRNKEVTQELPNREVTLARNMAHRPVTEHHPALLLLLSTVDTLVRNTEPPQAPPLRAVTELLQALLPRLEWLGLPLGKRKALFVGINYYGQQGELKGCINDVHNVKNWLMKNYPFRPDEILILTDDQKDPTRIPTKANLLAAMQWLVRDARPGDAFFLHYSGHGSRQKDQDGDEDDGFDETIVPVDYQRAGQIVDDELNAMLVRPLPRGSRLTAIFDCCHSGSIMDLPYTYTVDGNLDLVVRDNSQKLVEHGIKVGLALLTNNKKALFSEVKNLVATVQSGGKNSEAARQKTQQTKGSEALVVQFSGCKDDQTSADASIGGQATGAMSWALIQTLEKNRFHMSYTQVLRETRGLLQGKYHQIPQMSTSFQMDVHNMQFSII